MKTKYMNPVIFLKHFLDGALVGGRSPSPFYY
jgi:hypothetical protein